MDDPPFEDASDAGPLEPAVAELRAFLHASGALEVQGVVDRGEEEPPALITCARGAPVEVVHGDRRLRLPHAAAGTPEPPTPGVPMVAGVQVDPDEGRVAAPLGLLHDLAGALEALAGRLGGRSVAAAFVETDRSQTPLGVVARPGEAPVVTLGDEQFHLPDA